jgi:hypothetical protein
VYSKELQPDRNLIFRNNGKTLFVRISDNYQEAKRVAEGTVVTVKHGGTNVYGTLQFPKFYRERKDLAWDELLGQL